MLRQTSRKWLKQALLWSRVKLLYARITLNKFTTIYFIAAVINCIVLSAFQGVAYSDNSMAGDLVESIVVNSNLTTGFTVERDDELFYCANVPRTINTCVPIFPGNSTFYAQNQEAITRIGSNHLQAHSHKSKGKREDDGWITLDSTPVFDGSGETIGVMLQSGAVLPMPCLQSFNWLSDLLRDARREDVVTLAFQIWMLSLSLVTILNESLPHLVASLASHVLGTAWAAFRVANSKQQEKRYRNLVVRGLCDNVDIMGNWWEIRTSHTIPVIVFHLVALAVLIYLSATLYKVYSQQSYGRVGASPVINNIYKYVLVLSVCLQLVGFFSIASTGMWVDKILALRSRDIVTHLPMYLASFITVLVCEIPWVVLGWLSVRRENKILFAIFMVLSMFILGISSFLFSSDLFRATFNSWPFFATVTITSYVLLVANFGLAIVCRLHFGKGLAQYLKVTETLEGIDFTPVNIPRGGVEYDRDVKVRLSSDSSILVREKYDEEAQRIQEPVSVVTRPGRTGVNHLSIYSDNNRPTLHLNGTPPVARSVVGSRASTASFTTTSTEASAAWCYEIGVPPVPAVTRSPSTQTVRGPPPSTTGSLSRSASSVSASTLIPSDTSSSRYSQNSRSITRPDSPDVLPPPAYVAIPTPTPTWAPPAPTPEVMGPAHMRSDSGSSGRRIPAGNNLRGGGLPSNPRSGSPVLRRQPSQYAGPPKEGYF